MKSNRIYFKMGSSKFSVSKSQITREDKNEITITIGGNETYKIQKKNLYDPETEK